jgi:hypothetical protein
MAKGGKGSTPSTAAETVNTWIRGGLTFMLVAMTCWWLVQVAGLVQTLPVVDASGKVTVDGFGRAKDILLVILPLLTTALGYWFGAAGKAKAEESTEQAKVQLAEVLSVSSGTALKEAKLNNPEAFGHPPAAAPVDEAK